jgi:hypothetical protein
MQHTLGARVKLGIGLGGFMAPNSPSYKQSRPIVNTGDLRLPDYSPVQVFNSARSNASEENHKRNLEKYKNNQLNIKEEIENTISSQDMRSSFSKRKNQTIK